MQESLHNVQENVEVKYEELFLEKTTMWEQHWDEFSEMNAWVLPPLLTQGKNGHDKTKINSWEKIFLVNKNKKK